MYTEQHLISDRMMRLHIPTHMHQQAGYWYRGMPGILSQTDITERFNSRGIYSADDL